MTSTPAASRRAGITGRVLNSDRDVPPEVCSFRLPKVCSFQLPLTPVRTRCVDPPAGFPVIEGTTSARRTDTHAALIAAEHCHPRDPSHSFCNPNPVPTSRDALVVSITMRLWQTGRT